MVFSLCFSGLSLNRNFTIFWIATAILVCIVTFLWSNAIQKIVHITNTFLMFWREDADICYFLLFFAEEKHTLVDKEHVDIFLYPNQINQQVPLILIDTTGRILMLQAATVFTTSVKENTGMFVCFMLGRALPLELRALWTSSFGQTHLDQLNTSSMYLKRPVGLLSDSKK